MGELTDLDINTEEIWDLIYKCLGELGPGHYAGSRPPQQAYEKKIQSQELFAFSWRSRELEENMYIKFTISEGCLYYVSFHVDKKINERGEKK